MNTYSKIASTCIVLTLAGCGSSSNPEAIDLASELDRYWERTGTNVTATDLAAENGTATMTGGMYGFISDEEVVGGTLALTADFTNEEISGTASDFGRFDAGKTREDDVLLENYSGTLNVEGELYQPNSVDDGFSINGAPTITMLAEIQGDLTDEAGDNVGVDLRLSGGIGEGIETGNLFADGHVLGEIATSEGITTFNYDDKSEGFFFVVE